MKKIKVFRSFVRKDFGNLILVFMIPLMLAISLVISMCCYYTFYKAFKEEKLESTQLLISQITMQFDSKFETVKLLLSYLTTNQQIEIALKQYQSMDYEEQFIAKNELWDALSNIEIFGDCVEDILIVGENEFLYNLPVSVGLDQEEYCLEKEWIESFIDENPFQFSYTTVHWNQYYEERLGDSKRVISVLLPLRYRRANERGFFYYGYLQADMDYEELNAWLYQAYGQPETNMTIVNEEGVILFDKEEEVLNQTLDVSIRERLLGAQGSFTVDVDKEKRLIVYQKMDETDWYLIADISYSALTGASNYVLKVIWLVILPLFIVISIVVTIAISGRIKRPLIQLAERVKDIDIENYEYQEIDYGVDVLNQLGDRFEDSYSRIRELIDKVYVAEIHQKNIQYEILQKQITPHFMYNSLQLIKTEALLAGNMEISDITQSFSRLLRYSFERNVKWVELKQEKQNIEDYLNIYHKRFPQKFHYEIDIQEQIENRLTLKLVLQPIVENCIKHGFKDITEGGKIIVRGYLKDGDIWLEVEDNGEGIARERIEEITGNLNQEICTMNNVGLINVHRRIVIEEGYGYGLVKIESMPGIRTLFVLKIGGNRHV